MLEGAQWIAWRESRCGPFKTEAYSPEREKQYKQTLQVDEGSYLFRREFTVKDKVAAATLAVCGLGYYEAFLNGQRVGAERVLSPVVSDYYRLVRYDTYEVDGLLHEGRNVLAVEICGGWFAPKPKYWGWRQSFYGNPRMIAKLAVTYRGGQQSAVVSDTAWLARPGWVVSSDIYDGESVDFSRVPADWAQPGCGRGGWSAAVLAEAPTENVWPSEAPPVKVIRVQQPAGERRLSDTQTLFDFGENGAAVPCVTVSGAAGETVCLQHAEYLDADGALDITSENLALCTDTFVLANDRPQACFPRFCWHGYRYMLVTVSSPQVKLLSAQRRVIHSALSRTGSFSCSDSRLVCVHEALVRTQLACLQGVPIDCPQRDERKGWLGDAHVTAEMCLYNFDMRALYRSYLEDIRLGRHEKTGVLPFICPTSSNDTTIVEGETSTIDWNMAYPILLDEYDARYEDKALLAHHYDTLRGHIRHYETVCRDGLIPSCWFGDWFSVDLPDGEERIAFAPGSVSNRQNPPFLATVFYCRTLTIAARIAERLDLREEAARYRALRANSVAALQRYYDPQSGRFGSGGQFLSAVALWEHIVPEQERGRVFSCLLRSLEETKHHPLVGVIGTRILYDVLIEGGRPDVAWRVLTAEGYPGLLHMLSDGRTTLPEAQDGSGSGCHSMFGSPDAVLYKLLCGIWIDRRQDPPVHIAPYLPQELHFAEGRQILPEGELSVRWEREENGIVYRLRIPPQMTALVELGSGDGYRSEVLGEGTYTYHMVDGMGAACAKKNTGSGRLKVAEK